MSAQENEALAQEFRQTDRASSLTAATSSAAAAVGEADAEEEEADHRTAVSKFMPTSRRIVQVDFSRWWSFPASCSFLSDARMFGVNQSCVVIERELADQLLPSGEKLWGAQQSVRLRVTLEGMLLRGWFL